MVVLIDIAVAMRDGVRLATDLYLPGDRQRHPCLLQRVPYDRSQPAIVNGALDVASAVRRGYAVAVQDCRGRFGSEGEFTPFVQEADDGEDTVKWAAQQQWCNGSVAMFGRSYSGLAQWEVASRRPPALKAIAPMLSGENVASDWFATDGVFEWGFAALWGLRFLAPDALGRKDWPISATDFIGLVDRIDDLLLELPDACPSMVTQHLPFLADWLPQHGLPRVIQSRVETVATRGSSTGGSPSDPIPALVIGGWFDIFLRGCLRAYMRQSANSQPSQSLIVGPWPHGAPMTGVFPDCTFGSTASAEAAGLSDRQLDWFDRWMRPSVSKVAPCTSWFHMGANEWRSADAWPPESDEVRLYLSGDEPTARALTFVPPSEPEHHPLEFDENHPVPTLGGQTFLPGLEVSGNAGPRDQQRLLARPDVLHYRGPQLTKKLDITGDVRLQLYLRPALPGISIVARLAEERADGSLLLVCEGATRAADADTTAGGPVEVALLVGTTSHRFAVDSWIVLLLSNTSAPRFRRWVTALPPGKPRAGHSAVVCEPDRPSYLQLPVTQ